MDSTVLDEPLSAELRVRLGSEEHANVVAQTIAVDKEFSDGDIKRTIKTEGTMFVAEFVTTKRHTKHLRTAITALSTNLKLVLSTIKEFAP